MWNRSKQPFLAHEQALLPQALLKAHFPEPLERFLQPRKRGKALFNRLDLGARVAQGAAVLGEVSAHRYLAMGEGLIACDEAVEQSGELVGTSRNL